MNGSNFTWKKEMDFGCLLFCLAGMSSAMRWNSLFKSQFWSLRQPSKESTSSWKKTKITINFQHNTPQKKNPQNGACVRKRNLLYKCPQKKKSGYKKTHRSLFRRFLWESHWWLCRYANRKASLAPPVSPSYKMGFFDTCPGMMGSPGV